VGRDRQLNKVRVLLYRIPHFCQEISRFSLDQGFTGLSHETNNLYSICFFCQGNLEFFSCRVSGHPGCSRRLADYTLLRIYVKGFRSQYFKLVAGRRILPEYHASIEFPVR